MNFLCYCKLALAAMHTSYLVARVKQMHHPLKACYDLVMDESQLS